jgi:hypothetical protein
MTCHASINKVLEDARTRALKDQKTVTDVEAMLDDALEYVGYARDARISALAHGGQYRRELLLLVQSDLAEAISLLAVAAVKDERGC